jgi:hypothetical protein
VVPRGQRLQLQRLLLPPGRTYTQGPQLQLRPLRGVRGLPVFVQCPDPRLVDSDPYHRITGTKPDPASFLR